MDDTIENPQKQDVDHAQETSFTCEICIEPTTLPHTKLINADKSCLDHHFCNDCMIKYIQVNLEENRATVTCPETTCTHSLEPLSCRPIIPPQLFDKWCHVLCESAVLGVEGVYCPNRECSELILNECGDGKLKRCVCPGCKKPFCYGCKASWHYGSSCEENLDENDVAFGVVCRMNKWKRCPSCGHCVERVDGCKLITCRCGAQFCYKCGKLKCVHGITYSTLFLGFVFIGLVIFMISFLVCILFGIPMFITYKISSKIK